MIHHPDHFINAALMSPSLSDSALFVYTFWVFLLNLVLICFIVRMCGNRYLILCIIWALFPPVVILSKVYLSSVQLSWLKSDLNGLPLGLYSPSYVYYLKTLSLFRTCLLYSFDQNIESTNYAVSLISFEISSRRKFCAPPMFSSPYTPTIYCCPGCLKL